MKWEEFSGSFLGDAPGAKLLADQEYAILRIGVLVSLRRQDKGMTQEQLALRASVTQRQVSALENGKQNVTLRTLSRITNALELRIELPAAVHLALVSGTTGGRMATRSTANNQNAGGYRTRMRLAGTAHATGDLASSRASGGVPVSA